GHATVLYQDYMTDAASKRTREARPLGKGAKVREISSISAIPGSVLPEVVRGVLQHHVHARFAVAVFQQVLYHRVVLAALLFIAGARLGDDARDVAHRGHELLFDCFLERFVAPVADLLPAARGRPQVGDYFLAEAVRRRTDDRDLLFDGLEEAFVGRQFFLGVAVA